MSPMGFFAMVAVSSMNFIRAATSPCVKSVTATVKSPCAIAPACMAALYSVVALIAKNKFETLVLSWKLTNASQTTDALSTTLYVTMAAVTAIMVL